MDDLYDLDLVQPVYVPMPESLRDLLASGSTTTEEVLRQDITFRLFRSANPQLINFFVVHINQLLQLAFDATCDLEISAKAFAILEHSQPTVIAAVLADQKFHKVACAILTSDDAVHKSLLFNRLASLTLSAMYVDPHHVIESCGFILQLIEFLSEPGILSLFENMCAPDESLYEIQKWLITLGFPEAMLKYVEDFPCQRDATIMSEQANQLCGLFRVICVCGASPILGPHFCKYPFITVLNRTVGEYPDFVEFQRWETFVAVYCHTTKENMRGLFPNAMEILGDPVQSVTRCGVAAIDLLTVMMSLDRELIPFMASMNVVNTVLSLVIDNPNHTILHTSALEFFLAVFRIEELRTPVLDELLGVLAEAFSEKNVALRFTLYKLVKKLIKVAKSDSKLMARLKKNEVFMDMLRTTFPGYQALLRMPYGGVSAKTIEEEAAQIATRALDRRGV